MDINKPQKRIAWVDTLRGLGMLAVILGHSSVPHVGHQLISSFHMPLFFFISGYLFSPKPRRAYVLRKLDALYIPYLLFGAISFCMFSKGNGVFELLKELLTGTQGGNGWFLLCLLISDLLCAEAVSILDLRKLWYAPTLFILFVASALLAAKHVVGWYMLGVVVPACFFWLIGHLVRTMGVDEWFFERRRQRWLFVLVSLCGLSTFVFQTEHLEMVSNSLGNPVIFFVTALSGIALVMLCSKVFLPEIRVLLFIGKNTLAFLILHSVSPTLTKSLFASIAGYEAEGVGFKVGLKLVDVAMWIVGVYLINRWLPWFAGRANLFSRLVSKQQPVHAP